MWYRFAGSLREYLQSRGVTEDIIAFVESSDPQSQKAYNAALSKNPQLDLASLQALVPPQAPKQDERLDVLKKLFDAVSSYWMNFHGEPEFEQWILVQMWKRVRGAFMTGGADSGFAIIENLKRGYWSGENREIFDWYRFSKDAYGQDAQGNPRLQIATYNYEQALELSNEWHAAQSGKGNGKFYGPTKEENIVHQWDEGPNKGWTVQNINTENDLLTEGNMCDHCVASYWSQVADGRSRIYSLRNERNEPQVTMEMHGSDPHFHQIMGHRNEEPADEHKALVKDWISTMKNPQWSGSGYNGDFDVSGLDYDEISDVLDKHVDGTDEYGLLMNVGAETAYDEVMDRFKNMSRDEYYFGNMDDSARPIAKIAIKNDINRLKALIEEGKTLTPEYWRKISEVENLREKIYSDEQELYERFDGGDYSYYSDDDFYDSDRPSEPDWDDYEPVREEYDSDDEYVVAVNNAKQQFEIDHGLYEVANDEWRMEAESKARDEETDEFAKKHLPYGFNNDLYKHMESELADTPEYNELVAKLTAPQENYLTTPV